MSVVRKDIMDELHLDIFTAEHHLEPKALKEVLGIDYDQLAKIADSKVSKSVLEKNQGSARIDAKYKTIIYMLKLISPLCDNDPNKIRSWFIQPKTYWYGTSPLECFLMERPEAVIKELESKYKGEALTGS